MKELSIEQMEMVSGGWAEPDVSCVLKTGVAGAVSGGIATAVTGAFIPAGILGGWLGGVAAGLITCPWT